MYEWDDTKYWNSDFSYLTPNYKIQGTMTILDYCNLLQGTHRTDHVSAFILDTDFYFIETFKGRLLGPVKIVAIEKTIKIKDGKENLCFVIEYIDKSGKAQHEDFDPQEDIRWEWNAVSSWDAQQQSITFIDSPLDPAEALRVCLNKVEDTKLGKLIYL